MPTSPTASSLHQRVGQLCVVGFEGTDPTDPGVRRLRELAEGGEVGGAIFFTHNVAAPGQVRALIEEMRGWRTPWPLWLMVDQEGGRVQRLRSDRGFAGWVSARQAGGATLDEARATFAGLAAQVADFGFNANLTPVVDLHFDGSPAVGELGRSFGEDPAHVVACAREVVAAHRRHGVATALKHFPGHGSALGDTHRGFTDVSRRHQARELEPFSRLIASGHADMVMTSHLVHRPMTGNDAPLTLSRAAVGDTLRTKMAFEGVIVSDDLYMGALSEVAGGMTEVVTGALASGHDMLIVSGNRAARAAGPSAFAHEASETMGRLRGDIVDGLRQGRLQPDEVERSCARVEALKLRLLNPAVRPAS